MAKSIGKDVRRDQTVTAYQRAATIGAQRHVLDAREQPGFWRRPAGGAAPHAAAVGPAIDAGSVRVTHHVETPLRTSFGLGFGFAAGAWTFRLLVQLLVGGALLLAVWGALSRLL